MDTTTTLTTSLEITSERGTPTVGWLAEVDLTDDTTVLILAVIGASLCLVAAVCTGLTHLYLRPPRRERAPADEDFDEAATLPQYWTSAKAATDKSQEFEAFHELVYTPREDLWQFEYLLMESYRAKVTQDRPCPKGLVAEGGCPRRPGGCACFKEGAIPGLPVGYRVRSVIRMEDSDKWARYMRRVRKIRSNRAREMPLPVVSPPVLTKDVASCTGSFQPLDAGVNECYLWHGTDVRSALSIAATDYKINKSTTGGTGMYGLGIYLAESSTKADEYARDEPKGYYSDVFALLLCRVCMGKFYYTTTRDLSAISRTKLEGKFDSTVGDRQVSAGTFREFVVYDVDQMYPEYLVIYSRAYETTDEASLRALVSQPYFMQHPVYWRNAHKDPDKVFFGDQFELGRGALGILQRLVEAANSNPGVTLTVLRARRLELSADWKRYSGLRKAWKRRRPESPPGTASEAEPGSRDSSAWQPRRFQHAHELDGHPDSWRAFAAVHGEVEAAGQVIPMPTLDRDLNECLLWHGISQKDAEWVASDGAAAMVHLAKMEAEGAPGRFGEGVYFVEDLPKVLGNAQAHDGQRVPRAYSEDMAMNLVYAKMQGGIKVVILCRVLCGDLFYTEAKSEPDAVSNMAAAGKDAVLANPERRGAREFVVTKGPQIYPEYVIELQETGRENLTAAV